MFITIYVYTAIYNVQYYPMIYLTACALCTKLYFPISVVIVFLVRGRLHIFFHAVRHRDVFLQHNREGLRCAVYCTLERLWEIEVG